VDPIELTIITPVRNGAHHIRECLECVARENLPTVEHLVLDGASTDETPAILHAAGTAMDDRFRWISERDAGQSDAMNKGLRLARGGWVGFLNADDYYLPGVLPRVLSRIRQQRRGALLTGNCRLVGADNALLGTARPASFRWFSFYLSVADCVFPINPCSYFYPRSVHDAIGPYDPEEHYTMDIDFLLRATRVLPTRYFDEDWGVMRHLPGSKTFEDRARGESLDRMRRTIRRNFRSLPAWRRTQVRLLRFLPVRIPR